ncbi:hypothetical protein SLEP1_g58215 [Rubroshorea leprosula]|uniref:Uncharacterized protein n=1 Tax=Rubroshorea leprosula TaxID=152421 RepID=A0AAV5MNJ5_9ROSI|nr:hypothetical protein SLEP1_g58215 [Rubroshorea leprosula]
MVGCGAAVIGANIFISTGTGDLKSTGKRGRMLRQSSNPQGCE